MAKEHRNKQPVPVSLHLPNRFSAEGKAMTDKLCRFAAILLLLCSIPCACALQAGTPEAALEEIATADNVDTVVRHLPVKVEKHLAKLPLQQRAAMAEKLLIIKNLQGQGGKLTRSGDGNSWELIEKEGGQKVIITVKKTFLFGDDALVELEIGEEKQANRVMISKVMIGMHYENHEWCVIEAGQWRGADIESEFLPREDAKDEDKDGSSSAAAVATLRTLNTALVTYMTTYPGQGCPSSLQALSGQENQESAIDHAKFLDPSFLQEPLTRFGYEFRYIRIAQDRYQMTATPVQFGEASPSFFTDESGAIRTTKESRPALASDPPLE